MKVAQSINEIVEQGKTLQREKENDRNWSKIDSILERIIKIETREEAIKCLELSTLIGNAIQSGRSKLSGSGCMCLAKICMEMKEEMKEHVPFFVSALISALGKTNKVISQRALNTLCTIGDNCPLRGVVRHVRGCVGSPNKMVRIGALELSIRGMKEEQRKEFIEVIEGSLTDSAPEIRQRAREGMQNVFDANRREFIEIIGRLPEKIAQMISVKEKAVIEKEKIVAAPSEKSPEKEIIERRMPPSVISAINISPSEPMLKIKNSGSNVIVRRARKSFTPLKANYTKRDNELELGHSLERIGMQLEEHRREIEEALKRTPKKTPLTKKRQREEVCTPSYIVKREKEAAEKNNKIEQEERNREAAANKEEEKVEEKREDNNNNENDIANLSADLLNLSIAQTEETEHIIEDKEINDTIFTGNDLREANLFLKSCKKAAEKSQESVVSNIDCVSVENSSRISNIVYEDEKSNIEMHDSQVKSIEKSPHAEKMDMNMNINQDLEIDTSVISIKMSTEIPNTKETLNEVANEVTEIENDNDSSKDMDEYSILASEVSVKRATTKKA